MKSTNKVEVLKLESLDSHPNADRLEIAKVFGYSVVVRKDEFKVGDLVAYIPPDSVVDVNQPEFSFLKNKRDKERITAKKLRGVVSMGLLIKAPVGSNVGDNVASLLKVEHYEPEIQLCTGENVKAPDLYWPKYDVDSIRRYSNIFRFNEMVIVCEKIHGANSSWCFTQNELYCKSRTQWKKRRDDSQFWRALNNHPEIETFCRSNPDHILWGENYGKVQNFRYEKNDVYFLAFDIMYNGKFLNFVDFRSLCTKYSIPIAPVLYYGPFNLKYLEELSNGPSILTDEHCREGCVIRPEKERWDEEIGRVILKLVGNDYYLTKKK